MSVGGQSGTGNIHCMQIIHEHFEDNKTTGINMGNVLLSAFMLDFSFMDTDKPSSS